MLGPLHSNINMSVWICIFFLLFIDIIIDVTNGDDTSIQTYVSMRRPSLNNTLSAHVHVTQNDLNMYFSLSGFRTGHAVLFGCKC